MDIHKNARLTLRRREDLIQQLTFLLVGGPDRGPGIARCY